MSVITSCKDAYFPKGEKCTFCGDRQYHPPMVFWTGGDSEVIICGECCRGLAKGLVADMVHVVAILDLKRLGYHGQTLVRESQQKVDDEAQAFVRGLQLNVVR